ncbi:1-aminocyclopropane-1-carboxylate deaminase/D-cysteine desulfhydrase [Marinimicrobium sp. ABcell2]|uniref:1-aminocyclopropane-1-carboxylate deaminase/D-cysteine desulfhydrase n=1 Tax=Marinimicrobium sp. ABcell2 TaxID=3069751 RepID=UPI0027B424DC|nr:D-cysteine desulfhydrase family protein [Marinimicrobium sp. ABcell2]MDQ2075660.1 D-cysteine desulfhydrase family protein [Marinimicrobium sp. ABcell2]
MTNSFRFPTRLSLAQTPTPLQPLDRISARYGGPRIWVKRDDLTGCSLSGNKIRKLEFVLAKALDEGCDTLITCGGLQSNHCRATALLGAQLGLRVCLLLRGESEQPPDGNYLLDQLAGAEIRTYPASVYQAKQQELLDGWARECRGQGRNPWVIPTGASDGHGAWGYVQASQELSEDYTRHNISPEYVISASGSGGTLAGLHLGHRLYCPTTQVLGMAVCDDAEYFRTKALADIESLCRLYSVSAPAGLGKPEVIDAYIGEGYAKAGREVFDTIRQLASTEGLVLDPVYTGKAFYGMLREIALGRFQGCRDIVFVHTGGVFGLFPYREFFNQQ